MKETTLRFLDKADRALQAAKTLLKEGNFDFSAGRAYYAMFFAAEGLLFEKDLRFRKHGGVHAAFGKQFTQSGLIDPKYHRWLLDAFDKRILGDYGVDVDITERDAETLIERAEEFIKESRKFLQNPPPP